MIIEGKFLLTMGRGIGVIEVQDNGGGGLGVAGDEVVDQGAREPVEILAVDAVFKTEKVGALAKRAGSSGDRSTLSLNRGSCRRLLASLPSHTPKRFVDTLSQEVSEGVISIGRMSPVLHSGSQAFGEANLAVDAASKRAPKSDDKAPPSKSARIVEPAMGGKCHCCGVE